MIIVDSRTMSGMFDEDDIQRTVVDVVQDTIRILRVINDDRTTKTITVLKIIMRVVPKRPRLLLHVKPIEKRIPRNDGTLSHESSAVKGICAVLE